MRSAGGGGGAARRRSGGETAAYLPSIPEFDPEFEEGGPSTAAELGVERSAGSVAAPGRSVVVIVLGALCILLPPGEPLSRAFLFEDGETSKRGSSVVDNVRRVSSAVAKFTAVGGTARELLADASIACRKNGRDSYRDSPADCAHGGDDGEDNEDGAAARAEWDALRALDVDGAAPQVVAEAVTRMAVAEAKRRAE
uniref:Uncharacterized protein n=1 Tax=Odontella aurita TaxID=265563 RepID=A0A7S4N7U7_9STRA|mmetsp:Transcript_51363/g.154328  ORF Transcript_51363/g.154328 Transcript_51363/m.154328 type:complete len:197 (+) Transcript_51363:717-1307(+)